MKPLKLSLLLAAVALAPSLGRALPVDANIFNDGTNAIRVAWNSTPGKVYLLQTTTNIFGSWSNVLASPGTITATTNQIFQSLTANSATRFYRITKLDTDGPEVNLVAPSSGAIAVGQKFAIKAALSDETGINTNTISFQLGTNANVTLADSRLTFVAGTLTYTPGTNEVLGALGDNVTASVSATDTLGNQTTNYTWSFQIELPAVSSANSLFITGTNGFVLVSTNGDYFTYSYAGAFPGLTNGVRLVNTNISTGYTRTVVDFTNYPASNSVVVLTRPTKLAELLVSGSLSGAKFTEVGGSQLGSGFRMNNLVTAPFAYGIPFNYQFNLKRILFQNQNFLVELLTNSYVNWSGTFELSGNIQSNKLTQFSSKTAGNIDFRIEGHVGAQGAYDHDFSTNIYSATKRFYALIGGWPVWFDAIFDLSAGYTAHLEGSADYTNGVIGAKEYLYGNRWDITNGWSTFSQTPPLELSYLGPRWTVQGSANLHLYVQPKLSLLVYSAVGMSYDLQPYDDLVATAQINPNLFSLALYAGMTGNMSVDLAAWEDTWPALPSFTYDIVPRTLLWQTNNYSSPPAVTAQPLDQWVTAGNTATFTVQASGPSPVTYRWQKNGLWLSDDNHITGTHGSTLVIVNCSSNDIGKYQAIVSNPNGSIASQEVTLTVSPANIISGMSLIPAGSFTMGDSLDGDANALPLHSVYVSAFYMDRYEVSKALWDDVYLWATNHGYSFTSGSFGLGKAANHPVHTVSWYDVVKWCNARSEKENKVPAYYTDVGLSVRYRSGQVAAYVNWNNGYRLPTEAEWEKAARGGSSGQRFPWGNTINQSQANYTGYPLSGGGYAYDVNPTAGNHPTFATGVAPYTSPVGYFAPNGYGLYEMSGNVWEWCWDWYGTYSSSSQTDPRGPVGGSYRVFRGGGWVGIAFDCRSASHGIRDPADRSFYIGFRSVLPPGQ